MTAVARLPVIALALFLLASAVYVTGMTVVGGWTDSLAYVSWPWVVGSIGPMLLSFLAECGAVVAALRSPGNRSPREGT